MKDFPTPTGGGPFSRFFGFSSRFLKGFGNWVWNLIPTSITKHWNLSEVGLWGMISSIFGVIKYWYFLMVIPAIIVVYKLFQVLQAKGILTKLQTIVQGVLNMVMYVANECFPLINNIGNLASCVVNAPLTT